MANLGEDGLLTGSDIPAPESKNHIETVSVIVGLGAPHVEPAATNDDIDATIDVDMTYQSDDDDPDEMDEMLEEKDRDPSRHHHSSLTPKPGKPLKYRDNFDVENLEHVWLAACAPKEYGQHERIEKVTIDGVEYIIPRFEIAIANDGKECMGRDSVHPEARVRFSGSIDESGKQMVAYWDKHNTPAGRFVVDRALNQLRALLHIRENMTKGTELADHYARNTLLIEYPQEVIDKSRPPVQWLTNWMAVNISTTDRVQWAETGVPPLYRERGN